MNDSTTIDERERAEIKRVQSDYWLRIQEAVADKDETEIYYLNRDMDNEIYHIKEKWALKRVTGGA